MYIAGARHIDHTESNPNCFLWNLPFLSKAHEKCKTCNVVKHLQSFLYKENVFCTTVIKLCTLKTDKLIFAQVSAPEMKRMKKQSSQTYFQIQSGAYV